MAGVSSEPSNPGRELCLGCRRATKVCWCDRIAPFETGFDLHLLMHPRESRLTIGTGRMVHRFVRGSRLWVGAAFDDTHPLWRHLTGPSAVLFPGPGSLDLDHPAPDISISKHLGFRDTGDRLALVVVDGTWTTARRVLFDSPRLLTLPRIAYSPSTRARYDAVRREPRDTCHSTLEAVHAIIDRLDRLGVATAAANRPHDRMLDLLDDLVREQVAFVPAEHLARRATRGARVPAAADPQREARGPVTR